MCVGMRVGGGCVQVCVCICMCVGMCVGGVCVCVCVSEFSRRRSAFDVMVTGRADRTHRFFAAVLWPDLAAHTHGEWVAFAHGSHFLTPTTPNPTCAPGCSDARRGMRPSQ